MFHTFSVCRNCDALNKVDMEKGLKGLAVCGKCGQKLSFQGLVSEARGRDLKRIIKQSELPVLVDFWASWCGPCKMYGPEFEQASRENLNAVFLKVNVEEGPALSSEFGIRGIPCTLVFKNGIEVKRQSGALSAEQVRGLI